MTLETDSYAFILWGDHKGKTSFGVALKELCGILGLFEAIRMSRCNQFEVSGPDIKPTSSGRDLLWCVSCRKYHSVQCVTSMWLCVGQVAFRISHPSF